MNLLMNTTEEYKYFIYEVNRRNFDQLWYTKIKFVILER